MESDWRWNVWDTGTDPLLVRLFAYTLLGGHVNALCKANVPGEYYYNAVLPGPGQLWSLGPIQGPVVGLGHFPWGNLVFPD